MCKAFNSLALAGAIMVTSQVVAGPYDALPLRGAMAPEPHFQTSLGRESHRFSEAKINRYRLYDFYARQAKYHLSRATFAPLLLPYPGLEGGRRGHWGNTNEKLSSAVTKRLSEPRYHRLLNRGPAGDGYTCQHHHDTTSVCHFSHASTTLKRVVLDAELRAPVHAFSHVIDRFGFDMSVKGRHFLKHDGPEWLDTHHKPLAIVDAGHRLHQGKVIFVREIAGIGMLDHPDVSYHGKTAVFTRHFETQNNTPAMRFKLPRSASPSPANGSGKTTITQSGKTWIAEISTKNHTLKHRLSSSAGTVALRQINGEIIAVFEPAKAGMLVTISSWIDDAAPTPDTQPIRLSSLRGASSPYFTKRIQVSGQLNADPAARGTSYEIDEIPVPSDNPYGTPMTTCALAFNEHGEAFIATLVGDIWKVTGLDQSLGKVQWQRFASGLNSPLGLEFVRGKLHALTQHQIIVIEDLNGDGEADSFKPLTKIKLPAGRLHDLQKDQHGNLYFSHTSGIHRVSADRSSIQKISSPARNPLGLGVRADGLALSDSSEGNHGNGTCTIFESAHHENQHSSAKSRRILYLPRGVDNSPGSRIFIQQPTFGPMGQSILAVSYGTGRLYQILRDKNHGTPQAAMRLLPGEFSSGTARLAINPKDGQLYVLGFDGWGDFATTEGSLSRVRYTGKPNLHPLAWKTYRNGISIRFNTAIDPNSIKPATFFLQQWNYIDSQHSYGSAEYSVRNPAQLGHDRLTVASSYLSEDGKVLFLNIPDLRPAMCTHIHGNIKSTQGSLLALDMYATINQIPDQSIQGSPSNWNGSRSLKVPNKTNNGNTHETITRFFDTRSGKNLTQRPTGPSVAYQKKDLRYPWIQKNIIQKQSCASCHNATSKYDFSSYQGLLKAIDLKHPEKSHLLGMVQSGSMPPYPLPTVPPSMQQALKTWIEMGAPK